MNGTQRGRTPIFHLMRYEALENVLENSGSDPNCGTTHLKESTSRPDKFHPKH